MRRASDKYIDECLENLNNGAIAANLMEDIARAERQREQQNKRATYELPPDELSKGDTARIMVTATLLALGIGVVFLGAIFLFLLFCTQVWFK